MVPRAVIDRPTRECLPSSRLPRAYYYRVLTSQCTYAIANFAIDSTRARHARYRAQYNVQTMQVLELYHREWRESVTIFTSINYQVNYQLYSEYTAVYVHLVIYEKIVHKHNINLFTATKMF